MEYPKDCVLANRVIFDTHAHLDDGRFDEIRDELIPLLKENGVAGIITCGCDIKSSISAIELAEKYDFIYAAAGIHPEEISNCDDVSPIEKLAKHKKCVAIGEIGLDYYWDKEHKQEQIDLFEKQIALAKQLDLPVIIHDRDAHEDTLNIIRKHKPKGVLHCFSGSVEMAKEVLEYGMYIGVGGVVTFKNAKKLPQVIEIVPNDRLLLETDCPYLAPEPYRGKLCHSGMITLTAKRVAQIKNDTALNILSQSLKNAKTLFDII